MRAGALRHKVTIESPTKLKNDFGESVTTWTPFATTSASIEQMKAYDKAAVSAVWPGADYTITIRYCAGLTGNMRVNHNGMIYSILGQPNNVDGRNREMVLTCESGVKAQ